MDIIWRMIYMEQRAIKHFFGKEIELTLNDGFFLIGTVIDVYDDSILFRTTQKDSIIPLSDIHKVIGRTNHD